MREARTRCVGCVASWTKVGWNGFDGEGISGTKIKQLSATDGEGDRGRVIGLHTTSITAYSEISLLQSKDALSGSRRQEKPGTLIWREDVDIIEEHVKEGDSGIEGRLKEANVSHDMENRDDGEHGLFRLFFNGSRLMTNDKNSNYFISNKIRDIKKQNTK